MVQLDLNFEAQVIISNHCIEVVGKMLKLLLLSAAVIAVVSGDAMLIDPPVRTSAAHYCFSNIPIDYNDSQSNCGGYAVGI